MPTSEMKISKSAERGEGKRERGRGARGEGRGEGGEGERGEIGDRRVWCCCTLRDS